MTGKKGQTKGIHTRLCSKCKIQKQLASRRYCRDCHNAYMREWRKTHPITPEQRTKAIVRAKTKMRIRRGLLIKYPCEVCNTTDKVEAHHDDYNKPYCVRWLCRVHHQEHHAMEWQRKQNVK